MSLKATIKKDNQVNMYVSKIPALGLASQGKTIEEAKEAILEAFYLFVKVSFKRKCLDNCIKWDIKPDR